MPIRETSKKVRRIVDTSKKVRKVDPEEVRQALNAEYFDLDDEEQLESLRQHHLQAKASIPGWKGK